MGLDLSGLKYLHACSGKTVYDTVRTNKETENRRLLFNLVSRHNAETDIKLKKYSELHKNGQMSDSEYRMAKLEATAQDIIYQLGVNTLYNNNCA